MTTDATATKLIEIQTPRGDRCYVCPDCYEAMTAGQLPAIKGPAGQEYCQVGRGLSTVCAECEHPQHGR